MEEKNFETSLSELEKVVQQLEEGKLTLQESVKLYEHGMQLNQQCEAALKKAETKIEKLQALLKTTKSDSE